MGVGVKTIGNLHLFALGWHPPTHRPRGFRCPGTGVYLFRPGIAVRRETRA